MRTRDPAVLVLRVAWVLAPVAPGPALAALFSGAARSTQLTASTGMWVVWGLGLIAVLVPHPAALVAIRLLAPGAVVTALIAAADGHADPAGTAIVAVAAAAAMWPTVGQWHVNGPAYGDEVRYPLRPPAPLLVVAPLSGALAGASLVAGPLLLGAQRWLAGALALVAGIPLAAFLLRALYRMTLRWLVFVPAGVVLHDHLSTRDPVLIGRADIEAVAPALAGSDAVDFTHGAPGLALELACRDPQPVVRVTADRNEQPGKLRRFLFVPVRPGAVLATARARRLPVPG